MTRAPKLDPPKDEAWRLFFPVYWEPRFSAQMMNFRKKPSELISTLNEFIALSGLPASKQQAELRRVMQRLGLDARSVNKRLELARDVWIGMQYALRRRWQKPEKAFTSIVRGWQVSESVAETAISRYNAVAKRAIEEYIAGGVPEVEARECFRYRLRQSRKMLMRHHGPWTKRPKRSRE